MAETISTTPKTSTISWSQYATQVHISCPVAIQSNEQPLAEGTVRTIPPITATFEQTQIPTVDGVFRRDLARKGPDFVLAMTDAEMARQLSYMDPMTQQAKAGFAAQAAEMIAQVYVDKAPKLADPV